MLIPQAITRAPVFLRLSRGPSGDRLSSPSIHRRINNTALSRRKISSLSKQALRRPSTRIPTNLWHHLRSHRISRCRTHRMIGNSKYGDKARVLANTPISHLHCPVLRMGSTPRPRPTSPTITSHLRLSTGRHRTTHRHRRLVRQLGLHRQLMESPLDPIPLADIRRRDRCLVYPSLKTRVTTSNTVVR